MTEPPVDYVLDAGALHALALWIDQHHTGWDHATPGTPLASDHPLLGLIVKAPKEGTITLAVFGRTDGSFYARMARGLGMHWRFQEFMGSLDPPHSQRDLSAEDVKDLRALILSSTSSAP